jgi:hypothetical protein
MDGSASSSSPGLLPTPATCVANDGESSETWLARRERVKATANNGNGMGISLTIAVQLLKTPTSQLAVNGGSQHPDKRKAGGHGPTLADEVENLLPTPRAQHGEPRNQGVWARPLDQPQNLENALARIGEPSLPPFVDGSD